MACGCWAPRWDLSISWERSKRTILIWPSWLISWMGCSPSWLLPSWPLFAWLLSFWRALGSEWLSLAWRLRVKSYPRYWLCYCIICTSWRASAEDFELDYASSSSSSSSPENESILSIYLSWIVLSLSDFFSKLTGEVAILLLMRFLSINCFFTSFALSVLRNLLRFLDFFKSSKEDESIFC